MTIYPFKSKIHNDRIHVDDVSGDYIAFICPDCFNTMVFKANITIRLQNVDKEAFSYVYAEPKYTIQCTKCSAINTYAREEYIDPNIAPIIAELNRKGFVTKFSCEGHEESTPDLEIYDKFYLDKCLPYIWFKYAEQRHVLQDYPLVKPWYVDEDDGDVFCIRVNKEDYANYSLEDRLITLKQWVDNLPYCFNKVYTPKNSKT